MRGIMAERFKCYIRMKMGRDLVNGHIWGDDRKER